MLDVRVRAGEDEALAPCLLEETIMRGRRRGRNRPSPPSPPSAGSAGSVASGGQGTVKLLDPTGPKMEVTDDPTEIEDIADPVADEAAELDGADGADEAAGPDKPDGADDVVHADDAPSAEEVTKPVEAAD